ncbi:MAG TPA: PfkB family carbohydrate kinase [Polyangiaceae bacterium]
MWPTADRILLIGHLTRDLIRVSDRTMEAPGGTVHYAGVAYAQLGQQVQVLTKLADRDAGELARPLRGSGCQVQVIASDATTQFENVLTADLRGRSQTVRSVADPFQPSDVVPGARDVVHLGALTNHEMSVQFVEHAARHAALLVLDIQGFVRQLEGERIAPAAWPDATRVLPLCQVVKADDAEAERVTGERDPAHAALSLHARGAREVLVTMAQAGSYLAVDGAVHAVPALPAPFAVDSTGAGDTYTAGYVVARLLGRPPVDAARFAAAVASLSLAHTGPFRGTFADVEHCLRSH